MGGCALDFVKARIYKAEGVAHDAFMQQQQER